MSVLNDSRWILLVHEGSSLLQSRAFLGSISMINEICGKIKEIIDFSDRQIKRGWKTTSPFSSCNYMK
jgi:hypothetical protein